MSEKTAELRRDDNQFIHPWDDIAKLGENQRIVLEKGDSVYVLDSNG